jgi:hypothetical protein
LASISWQATISPRLLWDSAISYNHQDDIFSPLSPAVSATQPIALFSLPDAHFLRAPSPGTFTGGEFQRQASLRGGLSYVTGRHSVTVGINYHYGHRANPTLETTSDVSYTLFNGVPTSATFYAAPYVAKQDIKADMGIYAQDKWTLHRLTLTGGMGLLQ